jgi:hypothetical protein
MASELVPPHRFSSVEFHPPQATATGMEKSNAEKPMSRKPQKANLGNNLASMAIGDRSGELERRRSIFDTIEDPGVKEDVSLFFSNQAKFENEAILLEYAGKCDANDLVQRFTTKLNWADPVMARIIANAIVTYRDNSG